MEYFVSPSGSDTNSGSKANPFATIKKAESVLNPGDTCFLRKGVYREVLRPMQSGTSGNVITFSNYRDEQVIISGADLLGNWKSDEDGIYWAPMPWTMPDGNQVFSDGIMLSEACWPNAGDEHLFNPTRAVASGGSKNTLTCENLPGTEDVWKGAQLWCAGGAAWICWTSIVTGYNAETHTLTFDKEKDSWYTPTKGNLFSLRGIRSALDAPGEWFYDPDKQRLLLIPPSGMNIHRLAIEAKRRDDVIDLSGRSYIHINGIEFRAGGVRTDQHSSHITLKNVKGSYVSHCYTDNISGKNGILIFGDNILLLSCDLGYSSASVVSVQGHDNRIINCNIHHGGYAGLWKGTVSLSGRRIVFSHNTVRHAGRDLINTHGLMESLVQYNDVSEAGWLTQDLGMFYGHNTDYANTEFRYNLVHDNRAKNSAMGIYFDHLSHNAIVHHNVVWNVGIDPIRINNPSYCNLVYNNTCWKSGNIVTFDHSNRNDLFASRYFNNISNKAIRLPANVALENNLLSDNPQFKDVAAGDYRLKKSNNPNLGAYAPTDTLWRAGCDLKNPPDPLPVYKAPHIPWMNAVKNACFEFGTLEAWQKIESSKAQLVKGNGWGNGMAGGKKGDEHLTGTSKFELRLGPGRDGVQQTITGLTPNTKYQLSAWLRVSEKDETVVLGVKDVGTAEVSVSLSEVAWTRRSIDFTTGPKATEATMYMLKSSQGDSFAWCDNVTLPLNQNSMNGEAQNKAIDDD